MKYYIITYLSSFCMSSSKLVKSKSLTIFLCQKLDMVIKCFEVLRTVLQNSELFLIHVLWENMCHGIFIFSVNIMVCLLSHTLVSLGEKKEIISVVKKIPDKMQKQKSLKLYVQDLKEMGLQTKSCKVLFCWHSTSIWQSAFG